MGLAPGGIGLALGAGGARGCAHIGVIRGLQGMGVQPLGVAGASMGALVAALYALGASADELTALRLGARIRAAVRPRFSRVGLLDPTPLAHLVRSLLREKTFADAAIPLAITAVDLAADERVVLRDGPIAPAVIASMMVPSLFPPHVVNGRRLTDPGIMDPVPIDVAGSFGVETVVAVSADLAPATGGRLARSRPPFAWLLERAGYFCGLVGTHSQWPWAGQLGRTLVCMSRGGNPYVPQPRVIWIQPAFGRMSANYFWACERAIRLGEEAVEQARPLLLSAIQARA